jgi:asparagine synthase (glutamine-hydrolysing)
MCGIAGCFDLTNQLPDARLREIADAMAGRLVHRGPNEGAVWTDAAGGIALGHRRLSIVDLSPAGGQPMHSACGRYTIVFNGEIYNHRDLRTELAAAGHAFRGHSDTEVLLAAIAAGGVRAALDKSNGMFATAVWDAQGRALTLARDRLGIKPLYYGWLGRQFVFASELKALRAHPEFRPTIDRGSLALFLQHSYIPAPATIYQGVRKLPPGCLLTVQAESAETAGPQPYWALEAAIQQGRENPFRGSEKAAADELQALLSDAIGLQRLADVPVGAFLSGGIDSSLVVALMQAQRAGPVRTFTIGFHEPEYDEAPFAAAIAQHLRTDHAAQYITAAEAQQVIPRLPEMYDEPFADMSQIPTFLVSQLAREHVTVSLSGDGGDELFGGYDRYARIDRIWRQIAWLPAPLRQTVATLYQRVVHQGIRRRAGRSLRSRVLAAVDRRALYEALHRHWERPASVVIGAGASGVETGWQSHWIRRESFIEEMMALDTTTYLPDCILTKLDRASMAVSLEARVPLLDHRVVEFAWRLPLAMKYQRGSGKRLLRQILARHVPEALFERPKRGFGVPIGDWLRGGLRPWAEALLDADRLSAEGFFQPGPIREKWLEHQGGRANWQYLLWDVLMFQSWLEREPG